MPPSFPMWVSQLHCRPEIRSKLIGRHSLTFEAVRAALLGEGGLRYRATKRNGEDRREVFVNIDGQPVFVVVAPHEHLIDEYWLVTAYRRT